MDGKNRMREDSRQRAIDLVKEWAANELKSYNEPSRAGTAKGDPVGLSSKKYHAALLMVLHPNALELKDIAEMVGASHGVLRVWRTKDDFKIAADWAIDDFWSRLYRSTLEALEEEKPYGDPATAVGYIISMLPFLDPAIAEKFSIWAWISRDQYEWVFLLMAQTLYASDPKVARALYGRIKDTVKDNVKQDLDALSDPKAWEKYGAEHMKDRAKNLGLYIATVIDILAE
jgi:hypothetical protein